MHLSIRMSIMVPRAVFVIAALVTTEATNVNNLTCFATLAPESKIICPQDRNQFCMKEFVNSTRRECGSTSEYPNDAWDVKEPGGGLCVYRKCASSCTNETVSFEGRDGSLNSRKSVCCSTNLCNIASSHRIHAAIGWMTIIIALAMK